MESEQQVPKADRLRARRRDGEGLKMKVGPIIAESDGWYCEVVGNAERRWTIRVRIITEGGIEFYECWVNAVMLPGMWLREPLKEHQYVRDAVSAGLLYIAMHDGRCDHPNRS